MLGNRTALDDSVSGVVLQARDEKHALGIEGGEPIVIGVATIENHDGSRLETQAARHAVFVHAAFGDERKTGEQSLMIQQQMQFHRSFGALVLGPVENGSAELDERGVQSKQFVFETETMGAGHFAAAAQQLIKHAAVKRPGSVFIGVGQGRALGRVGQSQVPQLTLAGGQAAANLAQGLCPSQMTEQHGYELAPTTEPAGVALGPVLQDGPFKLGAGKQLQHLAENAGYSYHGGVGPPYGSRLLNANRSRVLPPPLNS